MVRRYRRVAAGYRGADSRCCGGGGRFHPGRASLVGVWAILRNPRFRGGRPRMACPGTWASYRAPPVPSRTPALTPAALISNSRRRPAGFGPPGPAGSFVLSEVHGSDGRKARLTPPSQGPDAPGQLEGFGTRTGQVRHRVSAPGHRLPRRRTWPCQNREAKFDVCRSEKAAGQGLDWHSRLGNAYGSPPVCVCPWPGCSPQWWPPEVRTPRGDIQPYVSFWLAPLCLASLSRNDSPEVATSTR